MFVSKLIVDNFRCIRHAEMEPDAGINVLVGDNTAGKTSVLESIFFLSRARSYRNSYNNVLIKNDAEVLSVFARIRRSANSYSDHGIQRSRHSTRWQVDGRRNLTLRELVKALPLQAVNPNIHQLLEEGPSHRRRFLDWGVFHVEHEFYPAWQRYRRAIRQRNRILSSGGSKEEAGAWHRELAGCAFRIDQIRRSYLSRLKPYICRYSQRVFGTERRIEFNYFRGWPRRKEYLQFLEETMAADQARGYTQGGPHRADIRIRFNGQPVRARASRGEQKTIAILLLLAQTALIEEVIATSPIVLMDDLTAELGCHYRTRLLDLLDELKCQSFISCLDQRDLICEGRKYKMFHVEQGTVRDVV